MVELQIADNVPQRRGGQVLDGLHRALDAVCVKLRVGHLEEDYRVYLHGNVILGDYGLRREIDHLLFERNDLGDTFDKGYLEFYHAGGPCDMVSAESLDHIRLGLRNDSETAYE